MGYSQDDEIKCIENEELHIVAENSLLGSDCTKCVGKCLKKAYSCRNFCPMEINLTSYSFLLKPRKLNINWTMETMNIFKEEREDNEKK
jgi:hypothetical protein